MKIAQAELLNELKREVSGMIHKTEEIAQLPESSLNFRIETKKWNLLEIYAHLNLYSNFYLPEIEKSISSSRSKSTGDFKAGFLGNYFAKSMLPDAVKGISNPIKTFKDKDTYGATINQEILLKFIEQQKALLVMIEKCYSLNLNKAKTGISISKWMRLKLGDTLRFYVNHEIRHFYQMEATLKHMK